jgi:alkylhydroperoxidase/carboxymuconolactone decarboxylase family protein YurZ
MNGLAAFKWELVYGLNLHLHMARDPGWTEDELVESLLHSVRLCGAPLIREALPRATETFAEMRA